MSANATDVECPTCGAWVGCACEGPNYGYHAAGYHRARQRAADRIAVKKKIDLSTTEATSAAKGTP